MACCRLTLRDDILPFWRSWVVVLVPLLLCPLPLISNTKEAWCGYGVLIIASYWMTEALPVAATALLPTVLFPLFGVLDTSTASQQYMTSTNLLSMAGLMVAVAVEKSNFHTRAALRVVLTVGSSVKWLMMGFMGITMFFSMWMSNTATTAMVAPMVEAVVENLTEKMDDSEDEPVTEKEETRQSERDAETLNMEPAGFDEISTELTEKKPATTMTVEQLRPPLFLCVAYAANCGGMGTLTGTTPNLVLRGIVEQYYGTETGLSFASYMLLGVPTMLLCTLIGWILLIVIFLGPRYLLKDPTDPARIAAVRRSLQDRYDALGPIKFHESAVFTLLCLLVALWFFREPQFMPGWNVLFTETNIDDGTAGMLIVALMFMIPARPRFWCLKEEGHKAEPSEALLTWHDVQTRLSWGIVLLLGGGFAVAEATTESGLCTWLGEQLTALDVLPNPVIILLIAIFITMLTEVCSNGAIASVMLPVMAQLAVSLRVNPLYLMLPTTLSCSFAFMLPVATPPNAIVFGAGNLKSKDMLRAGIVMNLLCVSVTMLVIPTLGNAVFDLDTFPDWANTTIPI
ncbi:solute carrier family 13 member 2-like [Amphibalanus amphitrite]|uniref:solute carrier family 13 member 2-like n=1 Tax=Amphibalanus amphitrite TaxID=1232801 RepID=UPI001C9173C0|nr:solute carrier family 13 member 2-like [Amphibalanus amphitrite]